MFPVCLVWGVKTKIDQRFADVSGYLYAPTHAWNSVISETDVYLAAAEACLFKNHEGPVWFFFHRFLLTEQFQIALMVEWARGVGNVPRFTTDSWGEPCGRGRRPYYDVAWKLGYVFSKQFLSCHWKWVVKFRSLKIAQLHPDLTKPTTHSVVNSAWLIPLVGLNPDELFTWNDQKPLKNVSFRVKLDKMFHYAGGAWA